MNSPRLPAAAGLCLLLLAAAAVILLPELPVWITDNGNRYLVTRNLAETGSLSFDHPCPELFPDGGFHFVRQGESFRSFYHFTWPALSVPFYLAAGDRGMLLPVWLAGAGLLMLMRRRHGPEAVLLLILTTPLIFYSLLPWEMTAAMAAGAAVTILLQREKWFAAGLLLGAGFWLREEFYLLAAALGTVLLLQRRRRELLRIAAGALGPALLLWGLNQRLYGHFLGLHFAAYQQNLAVVYHQNPVLNYLLGVWRCTRRQLLVFAPDGSALWQTISAAAVIAAAAAGVLPESRRRPRRAAALLWLAAAVPLLYQLYRAPSPLFVTADTMGLGFAIPAVLPVLLHWRSLLADRESALTTAAAGLFLLLLPFFLKDYDVGLTWSCRHALPAVPALVLLALRTRELRPQPAADRYLFYLPVFAGAAMQIYAVSSLVKITNAAAAAEREVLATPPEIAVTDLFFLPEETPHLYFEKTVLQIRTEAETERLLTLLERSGTGEIVLLLSPDYRRLPDAALKKLLTAMPPAEAPRLLTIDSRLRFYLVRLKKTSTAETGNK